MEDKGLAGGSGCMGVSGATPGGSSSSAAVAATGPGEDGCAPAAPDSYLLLFNVGKRQNWGTLLRSAGAFGVSEVYVVGAKKLQTFGNQGTADATPQRNFDSLEAAKEELRRRGARICGIEIDDSAVPVQRHPFTGPTAFMLGNEGEGMSRAQRAACDFFVYIPQHSGVTASLNVAVAGAIVLHHFAVWAGLPEQSRSGEKFVLDPRRGSLDRYRNPTEAEREEMERTRQERTAKRKLAAATSDDEAESESGAVGLDVDSGEQRAAA